jgi:hypothetical protein
MSFSSGLYAGASVVSGMKANARAAQKADQDKKVSDETWRVYEATKGRGKPSPGAGAEPAVDYSLTPKAGATGGLRLPSYTSDGGGDAVGADAAPGGGAPIFATAGLPARRAWRALDLPVGGAAESDAAAESGASDGFIRSLGSGFKSWFGG